MRAILAALLICLAPSFGAAQVVSPRPEAVGVVIYPEGYEAAEPPEDYPESARPYYDQQAGLAMISEQRTVDLPAGESILRFEGVAEGIVPQTAAIAGLPTRVDEQNFDFSIITPVTLIEHSVGRAVRLVRTNPGTGAEESRPAVIRSGPNGVVLEVEGGFEAFHCSGSRERIVFDSIPPGMADHPTLSVRVNVPQAGRYAVHLTYLTTGLHWRADYVARMRPDGRVDLSGWITLTNDTSTSFENAPVQVVAGSLIRTDATAMEPIQYPSLSTNCAPIPQPPARVYSNAEVEGVVVTGSYMAGTPEDVALPISVISTSARREDLGDYKLYSLPEPTTVAAHQTKQVRLIDDRIVTLERVYSYSVGNGWHRRETETAPASIVVHTRNLESNGLGLPLPEGSISWLEQAPSGRTVFTGESQIGNTATGLPIWQVLGEAQDLDVTVTPLGGDDRDDSGRRTVQYSVTNNKPVPVVFRYARLPTAEFRLVGRYPRPRMLDGLQVWDRTLAPGETFTLTLTYLRTPPPPED